MRLPSDKEGQRVSLLLHFHQPIIHALGLTAEIDAEQHFRARISAECPGIVAILDLFQRGFGGLIQLEFEDVNVGRGFHHAIHPPIAVVDFSFGVLPQVEKRQVNQAVVIRFALLQENLVGDFF